MVILRLNALRVATAGIFGLYPNSDLVLASVAVGVPAVLGVVLGKRVRSSIRERTRRSVVLVPLLVIGVRFLLGGLGVA